MKVALITSDWPSFSDGGVASLSETMATGLRSAGVEIEVWTRGGGSRSRTLGPQADGLVVRGVVGRSWRRAGRKHWARAVGGLVADFRPDALVVSPWDPLPGLLDGLPQSDRPPIWIVAHGRDITAEMDPLRESLRSAALGGPFRWLCLTEWMRGELLQRGVEAGRISVIPAAVSEPPSRARPARDQGFRILTVGRLVDRKGHDVLLRALAGLGDRNVHYSIVGDGPSRGRLEALAHRLGVAGQVSFEGRLEGEAFEEAWRSADLFAMLPRGGTGGDTEGYGLVFLEAAARGIPVLGTASHGAAEAVTQGVDSLQVQDPEDTVEVAAALRRLRDDPGLRATLGQAGRRRFENVGRPAHLASVLLSTFEQGCENPLEQPPPSLGGRWVVAVRAAMPSPRPQAWQAFQQAVGLAQSGLPEVVLVADAALPDGGPSALEDWLGEPLPKSLRVVVPARWHRPPLAGVLFRRSLRSLRSPLTTLLCRDPRVAATETGRWRRLLLEWHVRPDPERGSHRRALATADLHIAVSLGIRDDLLAAGISPSRVVVLPNACGLNLARAVRRAGPAGQPDPSHRPVLALGLHRRAGLDQALEAWRASPDLPPLLLGGRDQGALRTSSWSREVDSDPSLRGRIRFLGPVWGSEREQLLDSVGLWLCLYPRDDDSIDRICPLQVADASGSGLPFVASDLPSIRHQLGVGCGELVEGEDPLTLAAAIRRGLDSAPSDPLKRPRWKDRAKRLIQLA